MITLRINGVDQQVDVDDDTPLLWAVREELKLTGTKFGCGIAQCGACTMLVDGVATRTCVLPASAMVGKDIRTVESLAEGGAPSAVQRAWMELDVPQCGYCQSGQMMAATALLAGNRHPTDAEIDAAMQNICRCGTYPHIRRGIRRAAELLDAEQPLPAEGDTAIPAAGSSAEGVRP